MVIYHLVPPEEIELHEPTSLCLCGPTPEVADDDFWLGRFIGDQFYQHERFSPLDERSDFAAVGEEIADWSK